MHPPDNLPNRYEFDRFKYAEEEAHRRDKEGRLWVMHRGPDETIHEDGETYVNPVYVVEFGPLP